MRPGDAWPEIRHNKATLSHFRRPPRWCRQFVAFDQAWWVHHTSAAFAVVADLCSFFGSLFQPQTFDWHAVAILSTWFMTLLIQRTEHRDTQAIHVKLDELIHAQAGARDSVRALDREEPEDIEQQRKDQPRN